MLVLGDAITGALGLERRERGGMIAPSLSEPRAARRSPSPEVRSLPTASTPGRSLVTSRAVVDVVRAATLGSYGVTGFAGGGFLGGIFERIGLAQPGIRVSFDGVTDDETGSPGAERAASNASLGHLTDTPTAVVGAGLTIELDLNVAYGVPVAEVARQVDSAVRYSIRRALETDVERLSIHVAGLRYRSGDPPAPPPPADPSAVAPDDLAASGTDVA